MPKAISPPALFRNVGNTLEAQRSQRRKYLLFCAAYELSTYSYELFLPSPITYHLSPIGRFLYSSLICICG